MNSITINYKYTKNELFRIYLRKRSRTFFSPYYINIATALFVFTALFMMASGIYSVRLYFKACGSALAFAAVAYIVHILSLKSQIKNIASASLGFYGREVKRVITKEGFTVFHGENERLQEWTNMWGYLVTKNFYMLRLSPALDIVLPRRAFSGEGEHEFMMECMAQVPKDQMKNGRLKWKDWR
ncbi:MAG: YcxB family protein [Clostridia bacterium]|nr:YcxB family protein [Clostridia bacterium]